MRTFAREELNGDLEARRRAGTLRPRGRVAEGGAVRAPRAAGAGRVRRPGRDLLTTTIAMEALGRGCRDNGLVFSLNAQMWAVPDAARRLRQRGAEAAPGCRGWSRARSIGAHAITEPGAGSDVFSLSARARARDGGYGSTARRPSHQRSGGGRWRWRSPTSMRRGGQAPALTAFLVAARHHGRHVRQAHPQDGPAHLADGRGGVRGLRRARARAARARGRAACAIFNSAMEWERACIFAGSPRRDGAAARRLHRATPSSGASSASRSPSSSRWPTASPT